MEKEVLKKKEFEKECWKGGGLEGKVWKERRVGCQGER